LAVGPELNSGETAEEAEEDDEGAGETAEEAEEDDEGAGKTDEAQPGPKAPAEAEAPPEAAKV
jgi:hypothetical protein